MPLSWVRPAIAGLLLFAAGAVLADESATERTGNGQAPPAEEAEADRRDPPTEALPGPRLSDRPFRPASPGPGEGDRSADRDCCDMEH